MIRVIDEHHLQVGDRTWWGQFFSEDYEGDGYEWKRRQFIVHFESKWKVSVIWGYCTYSDNHDQWPFGTFLDGDVPIPFTETPELVEAAVFHADRKGIQTPDNEPFAYLDDEWLNALLDHVSKLHTTDDYASAR